MKLISLKIIFLLTKHLKEYPSPKNLGYFWNLGSLVGLAVTFQVITGIFIAFHYTPHIDLSFSSIESAMRDVKSGWFLRYLHSNTASFFFFLCIYIY